MSKIKLILSSIVITLCMVFAFSGGVNAATELDEVNFKTDPAIVRYNLITSGTVEETGVTATIDKWYIGGTIMEPGQVTTGPRYLENSKYIAQVTFTPNDGYSIDEYTDFYMNDEDGYFVSKNDSTGAITLNFEVPLHWIVSFETNTSSLIEDQVVEVNSTATEPTKPTKEGYTFYGWYESDEYNSWDKWDFDYSVTDHITLYALFIPNSKVIKNVNINLTLPAAGTKFTLVDKSDNWSSWKEQEPTVKITSTTANVSAYAEILKDLSSYEYYEGTIVAGNTYLFGVSAELADTYKLAQNGLNVTINGQKVTNFEFVTDDYLGFIYKGKIPGSAKPVTKKANPMVVTAKNKKVKYKKVKKKAQTVSAITVSKAQGTISYKKLSGNKKITVDPKTGKIKVKKKTKKGKYKVKVQVTAAGNKNYKAVSKIVTFTIKVK